MWKTQPNSRRQSIASVSLAITQAVMLSRVIGDIVAETEKIEKNTKLSQSSP